MREIDQNIEGVYEKRGSQNKGGGWKRRARMLSKNRGMDQGDRVKMDCDSININGKRCCILRDEDLAEK